MDHSGNWGPGELPCRLAEAGSESGNPLMSPSERSDSAIFGSLAGATWRVDWISEEVCCRAPKQEVIKGGMTKLTGLI